MSDRKSQHYDPPPIDRSAKTEFLRLTIARALSPRAQKRVEGLRRLENILSRSAAGQSIGMESLVLGSIARRFPVSHRAMRLELRGAGHQKLVEAAEQIELGLDCVPSWHQRPRRED